MFEESCAAVVLAAGKGSRMNSDIAKQYMLINGKPLIYYSLKAFQESFVDEIVLVVAPGDVDYVRKEIVRKYDFDKVSDIVEGGRERYHSVNNGLQAIRHSEYVMIHDGARPFVDSKIINDAMENVLIYRAAVIGMPVKDTIKKVSEKGIVVDTPDRDYLWTIQTPQAFELSAIKMAYHFLLSEESKFGKPKYNITDDAMVMERYGNIPVKMVKGNYCNIKITTPSDVVIAETMLKEKREEKIKKSD